ncbi:MAG: CPBP family intramembrane metalloprotease [Pirellulales bacterium]|nr:CPBP family intramembrane metalloprotease [Pirellulales bacterium]
MRWSNVKLILAREIRDQLRDRRTLFMIVVLPLLLYPLLGMSFFQISQFMQDHPTKVFVIGDHPRLLESPSLFEGGSFAARLFGKPEKARLLELDFASDTLSPGETIEEVAERTRRQVQASEGEYDVAIYFPPGFAEQLDRFRQASEPQASSPEPTQEPAEGEAKTAVPRVLPKVPQIEIICNTANERSQITYGRLYSVLNRWTDEVGKANLSAVGLPARSARPVELATADLAEENGTGASTLFWAKMLPVMLLLWALTGAFYPAVDLCAGEKERGTLETLLSSPAQRSEVVVGKLLTIMLFSMITAILNLLSMGFTGWLVLTHVPSVGTPSWMCVVWLLVALVPVSALFSALCLALAALARSTKEGQYYLMPLMLVCMPLAILPMAPGVELNLGNSLIPVTNVVLLLRALLESDYWQALRFAAPVIGVISVCCVVSIRWAVDQFNQESVLFRESERLDVGLWLRHVFRDRGPTPGVAMAVFCGMLILMLKFIVGLTLPFPEDFTGLAKIAIITQLVVILAPALLMAVFLTRSPSRTLLVDRASWRFVPMALPAAIALAVVIHPLAFMLQMAVVKLYPIAEGAEVLSRLFSEAPNFWLLLVIIAVIPPVCEELAFRGFILSGFRHTGKKWRAIVLTAVLFGMTHSILQQSLIATLAGVLIGYIAVQSGNLLPCIGYHMVHNGLALATTRITPELLDRWPTLAWMVQGNPAEGYTYTWLVVLVGGLIAFLILAWFSRLPYQKTQEEQLHEAIKRGLKVDDEPLVSTAM